MGKIFFFSIFIFACITVFAQQAVNQTDDQGRKQGFWQKRSPDGKLVYEANFRNDKPIGEMKRFHPNGVVKASIVFSGKSDTATVQLYDQKGKLTAKGLYFGQKKVGEWSFFSEGNLISTENYADDLKNGISKRYYQTGELLDETNWLNDQQEGLYLAFDKVGNKYIECMYKNGKRNGWYVSFYSNGEMEMEAFYKNNLRHGTWKYFNEDGKINYKLGYDEGVLMTPEVLDSIQKIKFNDLEKNKGSVVDPEQFMADPAQYILKDRMNK